MKIYVDDEREAPDDSWTVVRTITQAIRTIRRFEHSITHISLDHDIGYGSVDENFSAVAYFLGETYYTNKQFEDSEYGILCPRMSPIVTVHSDNPIGIESITAILKDYGIVVGK